jgi:putative oxidoreductase
MHRLLAPWADTIYAVTRFVVGALLTLHAPQLLLGWWGGIPVVGGAAPLLSLTGFGGTISLVGGLLVALGLFTTPAAFVCSGMLAVGYVLRHAPFGLLPIANGGEQATLYAFILLLIAARGAGPLSLDHLLKKSS